MEEPRADAEQLKESMKLVASCSVCPAAPSQMDTRLLGKDGDLNLFHATCRACGSAVLSLVAVGRAGASTVGLVTDLTADDAVRFAHRSAITIDDVISAHDFASSREWKTFAGAAVKHARTSVKAVRARK